MSLLFCKSDKQYGMRTLDNKIGVPDHLSEENRNSVSTEGNVGYSFYFSSLIEINSVSFFYLCFHSLLSAISIN